jgi:glycosyltransferase involved in cell wall biosynthesis
MHIVHLVTRLLRAGSEENTVETCRWQAEAGHRVTLIHGQEADPWWRDNPVAGVELMQLPQLVHPLDPVADLRALRALRASYRALCPDVIHTHQSKAGILGRLAASAVPDAVVAHTIHIVPFEGVSRMRRAFYIAAERLAARRTDVFIGVSEAVGHAYVAARITRRGRVHCVRSGMDLARFRNPGLPDDWRALLGMKRGNARPRVALMLAAFEPRKRHVEFLRAFARAGDTLPGVKLLLAGAGPCEARVRAEVQALGLQDRVVFCGHRPDPEALLALADVMVMTSRREGLPRVVVQSIAAGCPVLVSDMPGIGEVVIDGVNGHVLARDDLDAVVARMRMVLEDEVALKRLGDGAAGTDVGAWSLGAMGERTTGLYGLPVPRAPGVRAA